MAKRLFDLFGAALALAVLWPLLLVVARSGHTVNKDELMAFLAQRLAKWWLPDDVLVVDQLPHTATGKVLKMELRKPYRDHALPTPCPAFPASAI